MAVTVRTNILPQIDKPKMYLVFIIYEKHISWEFSMKVLMNVFHKNIEQAEFITEAILSQG